MKDLQEGVAYSQILASLNELSSIPMHIRVAFMNRSEVVFFKENEVVLEAAQISTHVYFVISGLMMCYITANEQCVVKWVKSTNDYVFSVDMYMAEFGNDRRFTGDTIVALEDTVAIRVSHADLNWLQENSPEMQSAILSHLSFYSDMSRCISDNEKRKPMDRYKHLQRQAGFVLERVPAVYLASLLKITLEELREVQESL